METTILIDDDIVAKLESELQQRNDATFEEIVNETLRLGLQAKQKNKPFKIHPHSMGKCDDLNYDKINVLLEVAEQN